MGHVRHMHMQLEGEWGLVTTSIMWPGVSDMRCGHHSLGFSTSRWPEQVYPSPTTCTITPASHHLVTINELHGALQALRSRPATDPQLHLYAVLEGGGGEVLCHQAGGGDVPVGT